MNKYISALAVLIMSSSIYAGEASKAVDQIKNTAMISFLTAFAFLVISFISPILAGIADFLGNKKRFMQFFVYLGSFSCIGLFWFNLDNIYTGLFLYFLALFYYIFVRHTILV